MQEKINKLKNNKPENFKEEINKIKKEQFVLAPDNLDIGYRDVRTQNE